MKAERNGATPEPVRFAKPDTTVSTLGRGMQITGNIVCAGALQIYGRVFGDIHATHLTICEGAKVEGKIIAPVVDGRLRALDAATGRILWESRVAPATMPYTITMAPRVIKGGKIIYADYKGTTEKQADTILQVLAAQ